MTQYQNKIILDRAINELKRVERMYISYLKNANPTEITLEAAMLSEERKRLLEDVKTNAVSTMQTLPIENDPELQNNAATIQSLENQSLSVINKSDTINNMRPQQIYNPNSHTLSQENLLYNVDEEQPNESKLVSPTERKAACKALVPNGCGARGDWRTPLIPNNPHGFDFTQACSNHDRNFSTLDFGFQRANDIFLNEMLSVPNKVVRIRGGTTIITPEETARFYHSFVTGQDGLNAYNTAQRNAYICKFGKRPN